MLCIPVLCYVMLWCPGVYVIMYCTPTPCLYPIHPPCTVPILKKSVASLRCVVPTGQKLVSQLHCTVLLLLLSTAVGRLLRLSSAPATATPPPPARQFLCLRLRLPTPTSSTARQQQQTLPTTSLKGTFILFSCSGYSLLVLALVPLYLPAACRKGPFFSLSPRQIVVYTRFTFRPTRRPPKTILFGHQHH